MNPVSDTDYAHFDLRVNVKSCSLTNSETYSMEVINGVVSYLSILESDFTFTNSECSSEKCGELTLSTAGTLPD